MSGRILKSELVIQGSDKTGAAFAGVIKHAKELQRTLRSVRGMRVGDQGFARAQREIRSTTRLLRTERLAAQEVTRAHRAANEALVARGNIIARLRGRWQGLAHVTGMGWMIGGIASGRAAHSIAQDTAEWVHQRAMLATAGMSPHEIVEATARAVNMRVPTMSAAENLKAIAELRMVFGSTEEALRNVATTQRAAAMMRAVNPNMSAEGESYALARALELKGVSMDEKHFMRLADRMVQAINASRGKVSGEDYAQFTKYSRGAAQYLSDDFYTRIVPSLIQEMRSTSAGRAMAAIRRQVVGGRMTHGATLEWARLGLMDPSHIIRTKTGAIKGVTPGGIIDSSLFISDPYAWIQGYLKPALKRHGLTKKAQVSEELAHLFSNTYAEQLAQILLTQSKRIEKDWRLTAAAPGIGALNRVRSTDLYTSAHDLGASVETLLGAFGSPLAGPAIANMNRMSDLARSAGKWYADFAKHHPIRSMAATGAGLAGLGWVGWKGFKSMFGLISAGPALNASATALDGSAVALNEAAAAIAGMGLKPGGPVSSVERGAKRGGLLGFLGSRAGAIAGTALGAAGIYFGSTEDANAGERDLYTRDKNGRLVMTPYAKSLQASNAEQLKPGDRAHWTVDDLAKALGTTKAELTGSANVKVDVEIKTEPGFWSRVTSTVHNAIDHINVFGGSEGSTGSHGTTMPEASPAR